MPTQGLETKAALYFYAVKVCLGGKKKKKKSIAVCHNDLCLPVSQQKCEEKRTKAVTSKTLPAESV